MKPVFVVNSGSSSLKFGIFVERDGDEHAIIRGNADAIGSDNGKLEVEDAAGKVLLRETQRFESQQDALSRITKKLAELKYDAPAGIGHRIVHGGPRLIAHQQITDEVLSALEEAVHFAPLHIPAAIALVRHMETLFPGVPQFACFDTAFHQTMPEAAYHFAIPEKYSAQGLRRYGFHGLSYASIVRALGKDIPQKTVAAHLGSGASLAAIADGKSVDTSMGLTPTGGIPMGTRPGDLDPGVPLFLMRYQKLDADKLESLLNNDCGLKALGGTNDMRKLQTAANTGDRSAQLAIEVFCRSIAKTIASFAAVLGGLELLVFAGGIGEHSAEVRANVCQRLRFLGVTLDAERNRTSAPVISEDTSAVAIRIVPSEEEKQIARECRALLS
ncbi:acetate/propionate family kinase [Acidobacterium sp. S8]|uniref:acetate/propionate family kinase n=1 Tax=Acidobacterium sp. S8 TaxID=1641854 RepID=UPI00131D8463|nr:acetate/propionate family kinase [Acidobacterium sp. S8]